MPKKLYPFEPPVIFNALLESVIENDSEFTIHTTDPVYKPFADALVDEHFPPQTQLPLG